VDTTVLEIDTSRRQVADLTDDLARFCAGRGDGLCSVFVPHATAGVAVMELGSGSEADLADALGRLLPRDDRYGHRHGARGHGADHLLPVLVSPSLVVPVLAGRPALGVWQRVVLVDTNADNPDRVELVVVTRHGAPGWRRCSPPWGAVCCPPPRQIRWESDQSVESALSGACSRTAIRRRSKNPRPMSEKPKATTATT
jgi:secondary thiamine-phosphate synthase enzyme